MKFGEIYDYRTAEEAKKFIGKKGVFSDSLRVISEQPEDCDVFTLREIKEGETYPFYGELEEEVFQFFRPVLEEEELMTNRQLAEWLAKGNGEYTSESAISSFIMYSYLKGEEEKPVRNDIFIRRWNDSEWFEPTKDIYEEDCK